MLDDRVEGSCELCFELDPALRCPITARRVDAYSGATGYLLDPDAQFGEFGVGDCRCDDVGAHLGVCLGDHLDECWVVGRRSGLTVPVEGGDVPGRMAWSTPRVPGAG